MAYNGLMAGRVKKGKQVGFRLSFEEHDRLMAVIKLAKQRNKGYAPTTDVIRELIGLIPPNLTVEKDRQILMPKDPIRRLA